MAKYKICPVCGAQFRTCVTCEDSSIPSWKKHSDSFEHFDIYTTIILYTRGEISKDEAAERLSEYKVTGYRDAIQKYLDEIFDHSLTDEVTPQVEVDTAPDGDAVSEAVPTKTSKKRRRNKETEIEMETVFGQDETQ